MSDELPEHVKKYLEECGIPVSALTGEALEAYASLSVREIALVKMLGDSLRDASADPHTIMCIH
jgi:hypothetical protein